MTPWPIGLTFKMFWGLTSETNNFAFEVKVTHCMEIPVPIVRLLKQLGLNGTDEF